MMIYDPPWTRTTGVWYCRLVDGNLARAGQAERARRIFLASGRATAGAALYRKYGFSVCGVRKRYYQDEDGLVMCKENISGKGAITDEI